MKLLLIIVFFLIGLVAIGAMNGGSSSSPTPDKPFVMDRDKAITFADWAIQKDMSPSNHDYKFPDYSEAIVTQNTDGTWTVRSNFAFKNYAGELEQHQLQITMIYDSQNVKTVKQEVL